MSKKMEAEIKVGLFVSVGVALIMFAVILLGGIESFFSKQITYNVKFSRVDGLIAGSKVALNGIRVGVVEFVDFHRETPTAASTILVVLKVSKQYKSLITESSTAEIATQGVLGDKYVVITNGEPGAPELAAGSEIRGVEGGGLANFLSSGEQILENLKSVTKNLDKFLISATVEGRSDTMFKGLSKTAKNLSEVSDKLNKEMDDMKLKKSINSLSSILAKIDNGKGTVGALINDPELYNDVRALVGGVNRNRIMRNLIRKTIKDSEEDPASQDDESPAKATRKGAAPK